MATPTPQEWAAYAAFAKHASFAGIEAHLQRELAETYQALCTMNDESKLRQLQGRAQAVQHFLANVADAQSVVDRKRG